MTDADPPDAATPPLASTSRAPTGWLGAAALIGVITIVARVVGFARIVVFARAIGPSTCLGNAYFTANTVPNIVFEIVAGGALASLVVPVLAGPAAQGDREATGRTLSALLSWTVLLLVPFTVAGVWLAHPVMTALVGDSGRCPSGQVVSTGSRMLLVFLPQIVLYGVGIVLAGALQAHRRFAGPALAPLLSSLVVIAAYLTFAAVFTGNPNNLGDVSRHDELILSVGTTLGVVALSLSLLVPLRRLGPRLRPTLRFPLGIAPRVRALAIAGVLTLVAQEAAVAVVLRLANDAGPRGAVTIYNVAWTVFLLPWAVLAVPIATSAFPQLTVHASDDDENAFAQTMSNATRLVLSAMFLAAAVMVAVADPVARILAQHGPSATAGDIHALSRAIAAFAPGLVGYGLVAHVGRALYARSQGRLAAAATVAGWLAVICADVVLVVLASRSDTVPALALGNSIGMTVAGLLLLVALHRVVPTAVRGCIRVTGLALALGAIAATLGRLVAHGTSSTSMVGNAGSALVAGLVVLVTYAALLVVVDRDTLQELRGRVRNGG
jgi:putative peptidoglycan lipid II flippase